MRRRLPRILALSVSAALTFAACGDDDDGGAVRDVDGTGAASGSGSASGSASASGAASGSASASGSESASPSGSESGTGLSASEVEGSTTDDPLIRAAVSEYSIWVEGQVAQMITETTPFTDAVRAGDLEGAKAAFAPSRQAWERIEPVAGLIPDIDAKVDARVDDFASPEDPAWTGWHRIEYILWELDTTEGAAPFADQLDADLLSLQEQLATLEITPLAMAKGAGELVEEVSEGKIQGEEDRYSHTDLWDFDANIDGAKQVIDLLSPALEAKDPELLATVQQQFADVDEGLSAYAEGDGWKSYEELTDADKEALQADLAALSESLATVPGTLGLE